MEVFEYIPNGVCSKKMIFNIEGNVVKSVKVIGGCPGNSLGVCTLIKDKTIDEIINLLGGIKCGFKDTSCPDQISKGLIDYKEKRSK